jgi:hypothetical protein
VQCLSSNFTLNHILSFPIIDHSLYLIITLGRSFLSVGLSSTLDHSFTLDPSSHLISLTPNLSILASDLSSHPHILTSSHPHILTSSHLIIPHIQSSLLLILNPTSITKCILTIGKFNHTADKVKHIHHFSSGPEYANIPGRVTINDLPSELILNITRFIPDSINSSECHVVWPIQEDFPRYNSCSLLQLALCSHTLHRLVEPVINERFHHGYTSTKGFLLFLVRILARPDLGRYVRVFHVDGTRAPDLGTIIEDNYNDPRHIYREDLDGRYRFDFDLSYFSAEDLRAVRKKIAEASTTTQETYEWTIGVEKGDLNALIALILTLTPNLQVLDIDMWIRPDSVPQILPRMLAQAGKLQRERQLGHPLALWGLKKVVVRYHHAPDLDNIVYRLISLLIIPSVEILSAIHECAGQRG